MKMDARCDAAGIAGKPGRAGKGVAIGRYETGVI